MQSVPREWLDFLRQQFPKDSRIQLTEIGGNPRPISPGSTGKLDYIDDAGQFHVKWDNGCTLALVLGEDRFSVYLPEPQTFKLYMPLTADFYGRDEWGDMSEDGEEWDGHTLMDYEGQILSALVKNRVPEENESGLMRWYDPTQGIRIVHRSKEKSWRQIKVFHDVEQLPERGHRNSIGDASDVGAALSKLQAHPMLRNALLFPQLCDAVPHKRFIAAVIVHDPLPPISTYYFNIRERRGFALKSSTFASHNE